MIAAAVFLVMLAFSGRYGYYGDELYFLAAGQHPAWGYVDQPPLVPLLARAMDTVFDGSLVGFRLPATVATAAFPVVTALLVREFSGSRRAQLLGAGAAAVSPMLLSLGHLVTPLTLDPPLWAVVTWLVARWVRVRNDWLLFAAGLVTAVSLQVVYLIPMLWIALALGAAIFGPRALLTRPLAWAGIAVAVAGVVPGLIWQARHGWPQLGIAQVISAGNAAAGGRPALVASIVILAGVVVGAPLLLYGVWRLLRSPVLASYRFLGFAVLAVAVVFIAADGSYDYLNGLFPLCWAAGAAELHRDREPGRAWRTARWPVFTVSAIVAVAYALPIYPVSWLSHIPRRVNTGIDTVGWPSLVDTVARRYHSLPPATRAHTAIVSGSFWGASAMARYGPAHQLPSAYSPNRGYAYFGHPGAGTTTVLYVGSSTSSYLERYFTDVRFLTGTDNHVGLDNATQQIPLWLCRHPRRPWPALWQQMRNVR